ncbi:hypothetical protein B0H14DRAFT_2401757, partial [Mycena olivaceomarginata]
VELEVCKCTTAAVQLMRLGAFGCALLNLLLAVDLCVLEFAQNLFQQISPNNTAITLTLERVLENMGYQLDHQHSLRRRFGNVLTWYTHLCDLMKYHYQGIINKRREEVVGPEIPPPPAPAPSPLHLLQRLRQCTGRTREQNAPSTTTLHCSRSASPASATPTSAAPYPASATPNSCCPPVDAKTGGRHHRSHPRTHFRKPPLRLHPSEYLRRRCPACFGQSQA